VVYIREAHAIDSSSPMGGDGAPIVEDPVDMEERVAVANVCMSKLALDPMPALIDGLDDAVNQAYEAWPDRLYLVGRDGKIAYTGGPGPFGFLPDELEEEILLELDE
jgi:type I thyroxine 5'-deiodinase